jgi:pimeloyl-ACP methyl ester carboxylesterase
MNSQTSLVSPQLGAAAQQALTEFLTPPRPSPSEAEQAILAQATRLSVPFEALQLQAFSWGIGPTVMLVHGWGGYGLQLSRFVQPLVAAGHRVLAFDAPAHGETAGVQTSGLAMARAITAVAQSQTAIAGVIAHSLGAASTTLALSAGLQTGKVVYLGAVCWLANAATTFARRSRLSAEVETAFRSLFEAQFGADIWQRFAVDRLAPHLNIPALLFHDQSDREVALAESRAIVQVWSGSHLVETSGLGHRRILRDESVIQQTRDFIIQGAG